MLLCLFTIIRDVYVLSPMAFLSTRECYNANTAEECKAGAQEK